MSLQTGKINILDFQVANMIAAGEVVDRPASVVKELIENAIDSDAKTITCEIRRGGVSVIRVTDDGCGMSKDDAEICILRHATSKIKEAKDLDAIMTLGFRGEALAAISSVSDMSIVTRTAKDQNGTEVLCNFGRITQVSSVGCPKGTTVTVRELFSNVPARRKFLKRDQSEGMACAAVLEKEALAHPEISFRFISDGAVRLSTAGDKKLFNAIYALLGREFASKLIRVQAKTEAVEVFGYVGRPDNVKANRNFQNFFINGRYVKSRTITAALEQAYSSFMESERFPVCVLNVVIHPALVDVNVHPTKLEVKFSNEKTVFDAVYLAVRNALLTDETRPEMQIEHKDIDRKATATFNSFAPVYDRMEGPLAVQTDIDGKEQGKPSAFEEEEPEKAKKGDVPRVPFDDLTFVFDDVARAEEGKSTGQKQDPFSGVGAFAVDPAVPADRREEDKTPQPDAGGTFPEARESGEHAGADGERKEIKETKDIKEEKKAEKSDEKKGSQESAREEPEFTVLGVAFDTYIFVQTGDKLLLIDKHAAHERLLFERMKAAMEHSDRRVTQLLLVPERFTVSYAEKSAALDFRQELEAAGFVYSVVDDANEILLTGLPGQVDKETAVEIFLQTLTRLASGEGNAEVTRKIGFEDALYTASCKAAMKGGRRDGKEHIEFLVRELLRLPDIRYCPHGRPVAFEIPKGRLDYKFGRS